MSPYRVAIEVYEGPVDLLLYFVHRDKLDVLDVPVARLADEFISYIETIGSDIEELSEFLLMASILLHWKMRVLLRESIVADEEQMEEPVTLSRILEEFQRYRETADFLAHSRDKNLRCYPRGQETKVEAKGELADLLRTFALLLERTRLRKPMLLTRDDWTIEDATDWLHHTLTERKSFSFFSTMRQRRSSVFDILVLFLAVLEQLRLNRIKIIQPQPFADFTVQTA